jgi:hypothetical protein
MAAGIAEVAHRSLEVLFGRPAYGGRYVVLRTEPA